MTNLVTLHVEEFQQVRGQRRKLTKALIVISTLTPMSDGPWNLIVVLGCASTETQVPFTVSPETNTSEICRIG